MTAFNEERRLHEQELQELKEMNSRKKFDSDRSRASKELQEIAEQRKKSQSTMD